MKNMRQGTKGDEGNTPAACPITIFSCLSSGTWGNMPGPFPGPPPNRCGYLTKCQPLEWKWNFPDATSGKTLLKLGTGSA